MAHECRQHGRFAARGVAALHQIKSNKTARLASEDREAVGGWTVTSGYEAAFPRFAQIYPVFYLIRLPEPSGDKLWFFEVR